MEQLELFDALPNARSCPSMIYTAAGEPLFHVYGSGCEHPQYAPDERLAALVPELPPDLLRAGYTRHEQQRHWIVAPQENGVGVVFAESDFNENLAAARRWLTREPVAFDQPKQRKKVA
jgi:hypothetical protein